MFGRTASEAYYAQTHARYMSGDLHPAPVPHIVRADDPEESESELGYALLRRLQEMEGMTGCDEGERIYRALSDAEWNVHEWLRANGYPKDPAPDNWDDETDWKEGRW